MERGPSRTGSKSRARPASPTATSPPSRHPPPETGSACTSPTRRPTPPSSERLGRRRWVIERTMSWLSGYRRLSPRYERNPRNYLAFLGLAAALCCYKRFVRLTT
ncbi:transposase [Streptomyces sp. NPDC051014]|uniref:transposase n=1 Tax=Streptomyces sp. NPDC051014 TaxID=3155751 RepID=UPI0033F15845